MKSPLCLLLILLEFPVSSQTGIPAWDDKPDISWMWTRFAAKIIRGQIYGTNGSHANVVFYGDSMAARKQWMMLCSLTNSIPIASVGLGAVAMDGTGSQGDSGGAFSSTTNVDKWITGTLFEIPPAKTGRFYPSPTFMQGSPWFNANRISVCVLCESSAGTVDVYAQQYGNGSPNVKVGEIDASVSSGTNAFWTHYSISNFSQWNIVISNTHASASVRIVGCAFADTALSGIGLWSLASGGATLAVTTNSSLSVFTNVISGIDADLILSEWKDGSLPGYVTNYSNALDAMYVRFRSAAPQADWIHFATHNDINENYTEQNKATWYHCKKHNLGFVDVQRIFKSIQAMNDSWMNGDGVHGNNLSDLYAGTIVAEHLGFPALQMFLSSKKQTVPRMTKAQRNALYRPETGRIIYQTDNTPGLRIRGDSGWMRFTETPDP